MSNVDKENSIDFRLLPLQYNNLFRRRMSVQNNNSKMKIEFNENR